MAGTKKKSSKGKAPSKQPKQPKDATQAFLEQQQLLLPADRMAAVRPLWQSLTPAEREALLTVPLADLRAYAKDQAARNRLAAEADVAEALAAGQLVITLETPLDDVLEQGLARSQDRGTWKIWQWPPDEAEFTDSEAFRKHLEEALLGEEHRAALPKDPEGARPVERPPEAAFRQRMTDLMARVQEQRAAQEEAAAAAGRRAGGGRRADPAAAARDAAIDLITAILGDLEGEHESIYHHCLHPVTAFVCEILPAASRKTTRAELYPEDLELLLPEDVHRIFEFLQEKVDALSAKLRPDAKELEAEDPSEEPIGDVDLFSLTPDGAALAVNAKWLGHLRSRVLGEDAQPRRAAPGEDPTSAGLVLEWVYGTIVSTAEKGRDAAHRALGSKPPSAEEAVEALVAALEEQGLWEQHARASRDLLAQMLTSRKEEAALAERYDLRTKLPEAGEGGTGAGEGDALPELPNDVILFMLRREALLTAAKLHGLKLEQAAAKRELRSLQAQLRVGEPQFERLKRELDELKAAPSRSLDGSFRNPAEMERARAQLADAAIEEQIQVQSAFRKTGSRLQRVVEAKNETEMAVVRRDHEASQLGKWRRNVHQITENLEDLLAAAAPLEGLADPGAAADGVDPEAGGVDAEQRALVAAVRATTHVSDDLAALRANFHTSIRKQLYVGADDRAIFEAVQRQLREVEARLEGGRVAVQHLLNFAINVACDDPGITIGSALALPFLQQRLDLQGLEWADRKAAAAQDEVIMMELLSEDAKAKEKERKAKAKAKAKEKVRSERERERADREAKEREAAEAAAAATRRAEEEAEEARRRRAEELEALRREEEAVMEQRRAELLSDEGSYWRHRAEQEELLAAQAELELALARQAAAEAEAAERAGPGDDGFTAAAPKRSAARRPGVKEPRAPREAPRPPRREAPLRPAGAAPRADRPPQPLKQQQQQPKADADAPAEPPALPNGAAWGPPLAPHSPDRAEPSVASPSPAQPDQAQQAQQQVQPAPPSHPGSAPLSPARPAAPPAAMPPGAMPVPPPPHPGIPVVPIPPHGMIHMHPLPPGVVPLPMGPGAMVLPPPLPHALPNGGHAPPPGPGPAAAPAHSRSSSAGEEAPAGAVLPPGAIPPPPPPHGMPPPHGPYAPPPGSVYARPPPPPPPGGPGMRPHMPPPHMFYPGPTPAPMVDGNGRLIRPPFVMVPHGPMPPGGPVPVGPMGPMGPAGMGPAGPGGRLPHPPRPGGGLAGRQLRAAAQPFVPSSLQAKPAGADAAEGGAKGAANGGSPRGHVLEPSELAERGSGAVDESASAGSSKAESTDADGGSTDGAAAAAAQLQQQQQQQQQQQGNAEAHRARRPRGGDASVGSAQQPGTWLPPPPADGPAPFEASQQEMMLAMVGGRQGSGHEAAALAAAASAATGGAPAPPADAARLRSVRGLSNSPGVYNCFLNVIIQSLWHLPAFRRALLALPTAAPPRGGAGRADAAVLAALRSIFEELAVEHPAADGDAPLTPVSPAALRDALGGSRFEHGDMHDAAEVLGELFDRLHAAEAGPGARDPTLPRQVRVEAPSAAAAAPVPAPAPGGGSPPGAGSVWGDVAALKKVKRAPDAQLAGRPSSTVQRLFGIPVQQLAGASAPAAPATGPSGTVDALQFTKYFHLVPAQQLRQEAPRAGSFEAALVAAAGGGPAERLLARPAVFTLGLVFESPQVPMKALMDTLAALQPALDVGRLFAVAPDGGDDAAPLRYRLRCMVCYSSSHYFAFALSEEAGQWVLLDDARVSAVGGWRDVQAAAGARRLQPSLLFYEADSRVEG